MKNNDNKKCCLCGNSLENQFGNNPYPLSENEEDRCCNVCNMSKVIPARIYQDCQLAMIEKIKEERS